MRAVALVEQLLGFLPKRCRNCRRPATRSTALLGGGYFDADSPEHFVCDRPECLASNVKATEIGQAGVAREGTKFVEAAKAAREAARAKKTP